MRTPSSFLPVLVLLTIPAVATAADCTAGNTVLAGGGYTNVEYVSHGSSFVAACTGKLYSLTVVVSSFTSSSSTLKVFDGEGSEDTIPAATLISSQPVTLTTGRNTYIFTAPIQVTAGQKYSWLLYGNAISLQAGAYASGGQGLVWKWFMGTEWSVYFDVHMGLPQPITGLAATPSTPAIGGSATLSVSGSGGSGNPVSFNSSTPTVCTVSGSTVSYLTGGTCTVNALQAGVDGYWDAGTATLNLTVPKWPQTITGLAASPASGTVGESSTLSVTASGASGNAVTYASTTSAVCTVSGSTVHYVGAGTCTVTADQAGNSYYGPATQVSANITVGKGSQTITGVTASPASGTVGGSSTLSVTASGASGNAVTFASTTSAVCTVSGSTVTYLTAGTCTVTADQAGNANYEAAAQVRLDIASGTAPVTPAPDSLVLTGIGMLVLLSLAIWKRRPAREV